MAGFGQLVPGMSPMQIPQMKSNGLHGQGMAILKAALAQQGKNQQQGQPVIPQGGTAGADMPMNLQSAQQQTGAGGSPGLLGMLMNKLKPQAAAGPIDPNTGLPVTQDVLNGAAAGAMPGQGIAAPTAISDLW